MSYLGHLIMAQSVQIDPSQIEKLNIWLIPCP